MNNQSNINATLQQRGTKYGDFNEHARITQNIKKAMVDSPNWQALDAGKKEALEMVAHKMGRILNGDPEFHDSWHDIVGYVTLVERELIPTLFSVTPTTPGGCGGTTNGLFKSKGTL